jgi:hypothetical protein
MQISLIFFQIIQDGKISDKNPSRIRHNYLRQKHVRQNDYLPKSLIF